MFANVGWGEMILLVVVGLVVLGPERLPGAIRWTSGAIRQARDYLSGATSQLREELGPEFEDLRQPLNELPWVHVKCVCNPDDVLKRDVALTALDGPVVGAVEAALRRHVLLRKPERFASMADSGTEYLLDSLICVACHRTRVQ